MLGTPLSNSSYNSTGSLCTRDDEETSRLCLGPSAPSCCFPDIPHYFSTIIGAYWMLVSVVGSVGNLLVLIAVPYARRKCRDPRSPLKTCTTVLLLSLSLADGLACLLVGILAFNYWNRRWMYG